MYTKITSPYQTVHSFVATSNFGSQSEEPPVREVGPWLKISTFGLHVCLALWFLGSCVAPH